LDGTINRIKLANQKTLSTKITKCKIAKNLASFWRIWGKKGRVGELGWGKRGERKGKETRGRGNEWGKGGGWGWGREAACGKGETRNQEVPVGKGRGILGFRIEIVSDKAKCD